MAGRDKLVAVVSYLRFAFYGRVSTEDWQDPATSLSRQREQAGALVRGQGVIVAAFFDVRQTRKLAWACRPQSAALVARLADPDRGWDAIVIGSTSGRSAYRARWRRSRWQLSCGWAAVTDEVLAAQGLGWR